MSNSPIDSWQAVWLGQVDYLAAWDLQKRTAESVANGLQPPTLLLLEHPHTYTVGRRGGREHILWDPAQLADRGISVVDVDRGGDVTYHGPGQLVGYPILPLAAHGWQGERLPRADFVGFIRNLEKVIIQVLDRYGIAAHQSTGLTGVWVSLPDHSEAKIASIGVKVDVRGVSQHGFALNVAPDMEYWNGIVACGIDGVQMTSMASIISAAPSLEEIAAITMTAFGEVFQKEVVSS
jgi:lipoate-protein ligase B